MLLRVQLQFFFSPVQLDLVGRSEGPQPQHRTQFPFSWVDWRGYREPRPALGSSGRPHWLASVDAGSSAHPGSPAHPLGLRSSHWWFLWMLEAPPGPLGSAVLTGWLLWWPLCLFNPELSMGPAARVAAKVQSQHPSRNQRHMINTQFPCPRPPGHGGDACSSLLSSFPSRIHLPVLTGATCSITTPLSRPSLL